MKKFLLETDPLTGISDYYAEDADGQGYYIEEVSHDITRQTIEQNKRLEGEGKGKDMWLAASIPPGVQFEWLAKHGVEFWNPAHRDGVRRLLNSSDYRYLRINNFMI